MSGVAGMRWGRGLPDRDLEPCGTLAAYRRHLRRDDPVDESCRQAAVRDYQDRMAAGYVRPPRRRPPGRTHLAGGPGKGLCGLRVMLMTDDPAVVTCRRCAAVAARHERNERARERRRAA